MLSYTRVGQRSVYRPETVALLKEFNIQQTTNV